MNKIVSTKTSNAIFLIIVLVAGTFAAISPSFIVGAQAEPYYEMDDRYDSYEPTEYPSEYTDNQYNTLWTKRIPIVSTWLQDRIPIRQQLQIRKR